MDQAAMQDVDVIKGLENTLTILLTSLKKGDHRRPRLRRDAFRESALMAAN